MADRSRLRDLLSFLSTIRGDLANIASPPQFLAPRSVVEIPACWSERPSVFVAPALESDSQERSLLVLKWFLSSLRTQFYIGGDTSLALKKPLNAFLGELFIGQWSDGNATTKLVTEQVSHHPPITACHMRDEEHGISAEGYSRVEMTFDGSINIKQYGHAIVHIDEYDEDYLIPFPDAQVKGLLSGHLYPEVSGIYQIISSSGFVSEIKFAGKGYFSGSRNSFVASMFKKGDASKTPIYTIKGQWSEKFTIHQGQSAIETFDTGSTPAKSTLPLEADPWESGKAWSSTISALKTGNLRTASMEKSKLEEAQRAMRKHEIAREKEWQPLLFSQMDGEYAVFKNLAKGTTWSLQSSRTKGVWRFSKEKASRISIPYHGALTPFGRVE